MLPLKFIEKTYKYKTTLNEAIEKQEKLKELNKLNNYGPRIFKKIEEKNRVSKSANKLFDARDDIDLFEEGTFPYKENVFKRKKEKSKKESTKKEAKTFSDILRMNQRILTVICLKNI